MKIEILPSAIEDLYGGRKFYEKQGEGLGGSISLMPCLLGFTQRFLDVSAC